MKKKLLFYNFIAILFITSNNIFLCCCDCNSLLYMTSNFERYRNSYEECKNKTSYSIEINNKKLSVKEINNKKLSVKEINSKELSVKEINSKELSVKEINSNSDLINFFLEFKGIPCRFIREKNLSSEEKSLIIFFHGNGESSFCNLEDSYLNKFVFEEYDLLIPELPGYPGNSEGDFSKETRDSYLGKLLDFCKKYYSEKGNVILGHSLGCYFATLLAGKADKSIFKKLVIVCPFLNDKTAAKYLSKNYVGEYCCLCCGECLNTTIVNPIYRVKLSNEENIKKVKCNIDILYAPNDIIIKPKDSQSLYNILKKTVNKQKIRLRPIIPEFYSFHKGDYMNNFLIDTFNKNIFDNEKKIKEEYKENIGKINEDNAYIDLINDKILEKNFSFAEIVGHNDVFLYNQIEYYILND